MYETCYFASSRKCIRKCRYPWPRPPPPSSIAAPQRPRRRSRPSRSWAATVLAFVAGVSASLASRRLVLLAGLAEMFAGAVSMGLGAFLGTRAEKDWYERERQREELEVSKVPHLEREELRDIYRKKGLTGETLEAVVEALSANEKRWVDVMMAEELGLQPVEGSPLLAGLVVGFSYIVAAA